MMGERDADFTEPRRSAAFMPFFHSSLSLNLAQLGPPFNPHLLLRFTPPPPPPLPFLLHFLRLRSSSCLDVCAAVRDLGASARTQFF